MIGIILAVVLAMVLMASTYIPGPADSALALQASTTKTSNYSTAWLDLGKAFAPGGLGMPLAAAINVSAVTVDAGGAITATLEQADDDGSGSPDAGTVALIGAAKAFASDETGISLAKGLITSRFVRLTFAISGATSTITFSANLNP